MLGLLNLKDAPQPICFFFWDAVHSEKSASVFVYLYFANLVFLSIELVGLLSLY